MGKPLGGLLSGTSGQTSGTSGTSNAQGDFFSNLMGAMKGREDVLSIIADQMGQKMSPTGSNVFGGLGTALAKSKLAGEQLEKDKVREEDMLTKVLQELRSPSGMNNAKFARDPVTGEIKVDTQTNIPKKIDETLPTEKAVPAGGTQQEQKVGSMADMMKAFK